jgi:hypothetical protein
MGELWVKGPKALDLLQRITTNNVAALTHPEVLGVDARKLDGHIEACEGGHLGTCGDMILGEWSDFEVFHCVNSFSVM